jgi:hypothetical protein
LYRPGLPLAACFNAFGRGRPKRPYIKKMWCKRVDYWNKNNAKDIELREELGLIR